MVLPAGNDAVIAQSVERILGKDEVASSNLANSSILLPLETGRFKRFLLFYITYFVSNLFGTALMKSCASIVEQPELMPNYPPARALRLGIDLAYGRRQITASVTSSILQGRSLRGIADDLQQRITTMDRTSAIRTARTAFTGAQNAGRMDSYAAAEKMGIKLKKEWLATLDGRTRHSHAALDGEKVGTDEKFANGCRFPGDPQGRPGEVYNCRCTMVAALDDVDTSGAQRRARDPEAGESVLIPNMTYKEWEAWKKVRKRHCVGHLYPERP